MLRQVFLAGMLLGSMAFAETLGGREFPNELAVGTHKLNFNGGGVREVDRFGMTFKVVALAMYTATKTSSAEEIMSLKTPVGVRGIYLRSVDGKDITESIETGFRSNCVAEKAKCDAAYAEYKKFSLKFPDMRDKDTIEYHIYADKVEYFIKGRKELNGTLNGADVANTILATYIGPKAEMRKKYLNIK